MTRARNSANLASDGNLFVDIANDRTGIGSVAPAQNLHVAGTAGFHADTTFVGDLYNTTWDRSDNSLKFVDNAKAVFGTDNDLKIYHSGGSNIIAGFTASDISIEAYFGADVNIVTNSNHYAIKCISNSQVELYHDNLKKFETTAYGTNTTGTAVNDGLVVAGVATVTTMNVTGVLTYDDVTSIDSIGIITARSNIDCNGNLDVAGTTTLSDDLNVDSGTLFVDVSSNRIGINQSSPSTALDVVGGINASGNITAGNNLNVTGTCTLGQTVSINGTNPQLQFVDTNHNPDYSIYGSNGRFSIHDATNSAERFRINSTGKITHTYDGTAYDAQYGQFEIAKDGASNADPDWSYLSFHRIGQIGWQQGIDSNDFVIASTGGSAKNTIDAEKFLITSDGDFGTNGVTPTTQSGRVFHLHAGAAQQRFHMTNNTTGVSATDGFEILIDTETNANCRIRNFEAGYMAFDTGGSNNEVMRLTSGGDVGINVTPISGVTLQVGTPNTSTGVMRGHPDYFSIDSGSSAGGGVVGTESNPCLIFGGDGNTGLYHSGSDTLNFTTAGSERLRIHSNGKITIGTGSRNTETTTGAVLIDRDITAESDSGDPNNYHLVIRSQTNSNTSKIGIGFVNTSDDDKLGASILHHRTGGGSVGDLAFYTSPSDGAMSERLRITSDGVLSWRSSSTPLSGSSNNYSVNIYRDSGSGYGYIDTLTSSSNSTGVRIRAYHNTVYTNVLEHTTSKVTNFQTSGSTRLSITATGALQHTATSGVSYFKGSSEYIFGSSLSSPSSGGAEAKFQIHDYKTRATMSLNAYMNNAGAPFLQFVSSRSGTPGVLGTKAVINDYHGDIRFFGDNGTNYQTLVQSAQILVRQKSTISDGDTVCAGEMQFWVGSDTGGSIIERLKIYNSGGVVFSKTTQGGAHHTGNTTNTFFKVGEWTGVGAASRCKLTVIGASTFDSGSDCSGMSHIYLAMNADSAVKGYFNSTGGPSYSHMSTTGRQGIARVAVKRSSGSAPFTVEVWVAYNTGYSSNSVYGETTTGTAFVGFNVNTGSSSVPSGADELESAFTIQTATAGTSYERLLIKHNGGVIAPTSSGGFIDNSYHANPDPFADGSGVAYYRMNYNFHDSGLFAKHGTSSDGTAVTGQPHFSLVNSVGEPCWDNPNEGAITIPNLKDSYSFSMAAWINVSSWPTTADNDVIMNLSINNTRVTLSICVWNTAVSDGADFYIMYGGQGHHYFRPSSKPTNEWIHVVYSVVGADNTDHRVYQNGADLTTRANRGGGHGGSAGWRLGGNANGSERFAIGRIGSIRFFNKALSSSEAAALYNNDKFIA